MSNDFVEHKRNRMHQNEIKIQKDYEAMGNRVLFVNVRMGSKPRNVFEGRIYPTCRIKDR
jgi:hypothetical protein